MATTKKTPRKRMAARKVAAAPAAPAAETRPADKPAEKPKSKKPKRVRGEFSMPEHDYARIGKLKAAAKRTGIKAKKNELLRLGLQALQALPAQELHDAIVALRVPKPGAVR